MEYPLYNQKADIIGNVELPDSVFGVESNNDLLHQVVSSLMANKRQVIAHAKTRSEVRGGGKKPWRQKGTGKARHGSIRSPIWKGGGVTFGPTKEVNFKKKIGKKMARKALAVALSEKARNGSIIVIDGINLSLPKTKEAAGILKLFREKLDKTGSILIVTSLADKNLHRAAKNIQKVGVTEARNLNPLETLSYKNLILLKDAVGMVGNLNKSR
ncbi:MAG: 50S ribosomal protein L4 [Candidatus Yanofskybacteria bacterium RIFCSPHIGHO2_01_FULL_43_42]|uniref:Large ribosomal subunit protein uL4 n=1 Tax=Candidatus Yanofskybacteria bacterium RIFCSPLOWO2_01_FULL_43_22 TaxID=1802695 RepID=A0A1F8GF86_9BACT|nr:MAG: 50S ribosomal protein L4 [Candidatus Yanofskybacteria bacterium RIFCSPHIGHO2_01_FULL_43_42]OGN12573.1 MAG: 50S ribosomal protein L4 [Candidatus Yanofskybacteria bacterium RIFCSPHIGHO2_02_FULL_43_17]OGN23720.1 MAG: 50S ribosomal protein L4 [Candidatus Yanofskybacteria bacterium RIFCSPLOWO2_01_FULL_43_22]